jgi:hypothetical protein
MAQRWQPPDDVDDLIAQLAAPDCAVLTDRKRAIYILYKNKSQAGSGGPGIAEQEGWKGFPSARAHPAFLRHAARVHTHILYISVLLEQRMLENLLLLFFSTYKILGTNWKTKLSHWIRDIIICCLAWLQRGRQWGTAQRASEPDGQKTDQISWMSLFYVSFFFSKY